MAQQPRIDRTLPELVSALQSHVNRLHEFGYRAFEQQESEMLGEVAGKLRLLLYESRTNKALLLSLMDQFGIEVMFESDRPWGKERKTLREFLANVFWVGLTPSGDYKQLTYTEFLSTWAQQDGAAHEDWAHDERYFAVRRPDLFINGVEPAVLGLRNITNAALYAAKEFFQRLTPELIEAKERERQACTV